MSVGLVVLLFLVSPRSPATASPVPGGVSLGSAYELGTLMKMTAAGQSAVMARITATGASWIRIDYNDEFSPGQLDYKLDPMVRQMVHHGLGVDAILEVPWWAATSGGPVDISTTALFMEEAASHLHTLGVNTFEIINEPNLHMGGGTGLSVPEYVRLLEAIHPVIHAADAAAVVLAGPSGLATTSATQMSQTDYLSQMYAHGAAGDFDALSLHPYTFPNAPATAGGANSWAAIPALHRLMAAHGDGAVPIWYTEFGAPTAGARSVTPAAQALAYRQAFALARSWSWSGPLFAFNWQDSADGAFGLNDGAGYPKPALQAFRAAVSGG